MHPDKGFGAAAGTALTSPGAIIACRGYNLLTFLSLQRHGFLEARYSYLSCPHRLGPRLADPIPSPTGFAGNDSPSFVFPTAIATKGAGGGAGGTGSGRPAVANKPTFLTGGAGQGGNVNMKRGTEDLDYFIGDEAIAASGGPGELDYQFLNYGTLR